MRKGKDWLDCISEEMRKKLVRKVGQIQVSGKS